MRDQDNKSSWRWYVCALMMVATVINYMDRMTLNLLADKVQQEFSLNEEQYGQMELGFGFAFAAGSLFFGWLIDRIGVYWLYPFILAGWSTVGFLSGLSQSYEGLLTLRVLLGFFESGHFPCALKAVQILMTARDRPLANSILQSGSAMGAILAPQAIKFLLADSPQGWRQPFLIIGAGGGSWVFFGSCRSGHATCRWAREPGPCRRQRHSSTVATLLPYIRLNEKSIDGPAAAHTRQPAGKKARRFVPAPRSTAKFLALSSW